MARKSIVLDTCMVIVKTDSHIRSSKNDFLNSAIWSKSYM